MKVLDPQNTHKKFAFIHEVYTLPVLIHDTQKILVC